MEPMGQPTENKNTHTMSDNTSSGIHKKGLSRSSSSTRNGSRFRSPIHTKALMILLGVLVMGVIVVLIVWEVTHRSSSKPSNMWNKSTFADDDDDTKDKIKDKKDDKSSKWRISPVEEFHSDPFKTNTYDSSHFIEAFQRALNHRVHVDCLRWPIEFPEPHSMENVEHQNMKTPSMWANIRGVLRDPHSGLWDARVAPGAMQKSVYVCAVVQSYLYPHQLFRPLAQYVQSTIDEKFGDYKKGITFRHVGTDKSKGALETLHENLTARGDQEYSSTFQTHAPTNIDAYFTLATTFAHTPDTIHKRAVTKELEHVVGYLVDASLPHWVQVHQHHPHADTSTPAPLLRPTDLQRCWCCVMICPLVYAHTYLRTDVRMTYKHMWVYVCLILEVVFSRPQFQDYPQHFQREFLLFILEQMLHAVPGQATSMYHTQNEFFANGEPQNLTKHDLDKNLFNDAFSSSAASSIGDSTTDVSVENPEWVVPVPYNKSTSAARTPCLTGGVYGTLGAVHRLWHRSRVNGLSPPQQTTGGVSVPLQCGHMISESLPDNEF
jgi:hypothetical protein